jgi:hypothetical protein
MALDVVFTTLHFLCDLKNVTGKLMCHIKLGCKGFP